MEQGKIQTLYDFETKEAVAPRTVLEAITGTGTEGQVVGFTKDNVIGAMNPPQTGITEEDADNRYLQLSGGTMTGALSVQEPTEDVNAVNKGYVDDAVQRKSNPNLLDNWYFVNPINQRGQTEYTAGSYTIDRWFSKSSYKINVKVNSGYITIIDHGEGNMYYSIIQIMKNPDFFAGKTVTYSALVSSESACQSKINARDDTSGKWLNNTIHNIPAGELILVSDTFTVPKSLNYVNFQPWSHEIPINYHAAKLELGSQQTLAHRDGNTWVLNDPPPDPALELTKCQRYYQVFATETLRPTEAEDFRPTMRANPTMSTIVVNGKTLYTADANL